VDRSLPAPDSDQLLEELLESLLADFEYWFRRGLQLLELAPDALLPPSEQRRLATALTSALAELTAARALRRAVERDPRRAGAVPSSKGVLERAGS